MKRFTVFLTAVLLVLASCQLPVGAGGSVTVVLPGSTSRATLDGSTDVRLQLTRNGVIVPISGADFIEKSLSGQTVSISGLVPGPGYVLLVSTGAREASESFYRTKLFQSSTPFEISAGVDTAVTVTLDNTRVEVIESVANSAHAAVFADPNLYYAEGSNIVQAGGGTIVPNYSGTLRGLGHDGATPWLNTTVGVSVNGVAVNMSTADGPIAPSVLESGNISLGGNSISYYYGDGLTAGVKVNSETNWKTMDELLDFDQSLKDKLNGQIFRGVAATSNFAVIATSIGAFRIVSGMLTTADDVGNYLTDGKDQNGDPIDIQPADNSLLIGPLSAYSDGTKNLIFGGTTKGLYAGPTSSAGAPMGGSLPLVAGTQGLSITNLATYPNQFTPSGESAGVFSAAYSASTRELLLLKDTTVIKRVSAFEGLPSGNPRLTFYVDGQVLYVVITGNDATVRVPVAVASVS